LKFSQWQKFRVYFSGLLQNVASQTIINILEKPAAPILRVENYKTTVCHQSCQNLNLRRSYGRVYAGQIQFRSCQRKQFFLCAMINQKLGTKEEQANY
jgi:hypothetical protein